MGELMARMASVDCLAKWARTARRELLEPQGHLVFLGRTANRASQAQLELMVNQESQGMLADQVLARSARLASRAKEVSMARLVCLVCLVPKVKWVHSESLASPAKTER